MSQTQIRRLRLERGLSQSELAVRAGVSITTISLLERQAGYDPAVRVKRRLADALDIPFKDLWPPQPAVADVA